LNRFNLGAEFSGGVTQSSMDFGEMIDNGFITFLSVKSPLVN